MASPVTTAAAPTAMDDDAATSTTSTTVDAPTTTRRRTALCHNCLTPAPYPLPILCTRGHCHGTVRYCSDVCRDEDCNVNVGGKHGPISCRFLGQLSSALGRRNGNGEEDGDGKRRGRRRRGTRVLIGLGDEPFPTYRRIRCRQRRRRRIDDCSDSDGDSEEEEGMEYEPTGNYVTLRAGEHAFEVVRMPHEFDGGGGLLLRRLPPSSSSSIPATSHTNTKSSSKQQHGHDDDDDTLYILSDVEALEFPVPPRLDKCNRAAFHDATMPLWHEGVEMWHRRKDYLSAMDRFDDALRSIRWGDDDGGEGAVREFAETTTSRTTSSSSSSSSPLLATIDDLERCAAALHGPPVACPRTRLELSRMAHFYGMCCNDAGRTNEARMWFGRALRIVPLPSMIGCDGGGGGESGRSAAILSEVEGNDSSLRTNGRRRRDWIQSCLAEFMLSYEEVGMVELARAVARWSIERGVGGGGGDGWWTNEFQRPGFMYPMMPSAAEEEEVVQGTIGACASLSSSRPYYPRHGGFFPDWCRALEENYDMILGEFFDLVERGGHGGGNNNKDNNNKKSSNGGRAAGEKDDGDPDTTEASLSPKMTPTPLRQPLHWPAVGSGEHRPSGRTDDRVVSDGGDWRETVLFGPGCHHPPSSDVAPKMRALLRRWAHDDVIDLAEDGGGEVIFSVLGPNTKIEPHCAIANVRLTAHLGLVVPSSSSSPASFGAATAAHPKVSRAQPRCAIRVADEWHQWERGKVILFDDSYEHEVVNDTNACRAVLLVRFWHPAVPVEERRRVLDEVRRRREDDERIRFNPPLPTGLGYVEGRF